MIKGTKGCTLLTRGFLLTLLLPWSIIFSSSPHAAASTPPASTTGGGTLYGHFDLHEFSGRSEPAERFLMKKERAHLGWMRGLGQRSGG
ncbi:unnamed protein product [Cuscuta campestris]|uniref:Uncharacterized protein n=1 Tax=Cuscuta campestris TaxID=132261 RepID=A0A484LPQ6_9ASTE|nr:unnamed protein product [Cuscuta campestris]